MLTTAVSLLCCLVVGACGLFGPQTSRAKASLRTDHGLQTPADRVRALAADEREAAGSLERQWQHLHPDQRNMAAMTWAAYSVAYGPPEPGGAESAPRAPAEQAHIALLETWGITRLSVVRAMEPTHRGEADVTEVLGRFAEARFGDRLFEFLRQYDRQVIARMPVEEREGIRAPGVPEIGDPSNWAVERVGRGVAVAARLDEEGDPIHLRRAQDGRWYVWLQLN